MNKLVKDVMTAHMVYARRDATFKADDAGKVVGVISESDMLSKEALDGGEGLTGVLSVFLRHEEFGKADAVTAPGFYVNH
jgi:CBS domain-containing protein